MNSVDKSVPVFFSDGRWNILIIISQRKDVQVHYDRNCSEGSVPAFCFAQVLVSRWSVYIRQGRQMEEMGCAQLCEVDTSLTDVWWGWGWQMGDRRVCTLVTVPNTFQWWLFNACNGLAQRKSSCHSWTPCVGSKVCSHWGEDERVARLPLRR